MKYKNISYLNKDGKRHRLDGPAIIRANGAKAWWVNGYRHREDGPAIIKPDGSKQWYQNNRIHRLDGPAYIGADGFKVWYQNGNHCGYGREPPEDYLKELERLGIKFDRGSDDPEDYPE